jgi:hypothetical protein
MTSDRKSLGMFRVFGVSFVCFSDESVAAACGGGRIGGRFSTADVKHEHPYTSSQVSIPYTNRSSPMLVFSWYVTLLLSGPVTLYSRNISCNFGSSSSTILRESAHDEDGPLPKKGKGVFTN